MVFIDYLKQTLFLFLIFLYIDVNLNYGEVNTKFPRSIKDVASMCKSFPAVFPGIVHFQNDHNIKVHSLNENDMRESEMDCHQ